MNAGGTLYFFADDGVNGLMLWTSDGTEQGTVPAHSAGDGPLRPKSCFFPPATSFGVAGDRLFVVGTRPEVGEELFTQVLIDPPAVTGDYNRNGLVDANDYNLWFTSYGLGTRLVADGNGDGKIDLADYTVWRDALDAALAPAALSPAAETPRLTRAVTAPITDEPVAEQNSVSTPLAAPTLSSLSASSEASPSDALPPAAADERTELLLLHAGVALDEADDAGAAFAHSSDETLDAALADFGAEWRPWGAPR